MPSNYTANNAQAYERLMRRWNGRLAKALIDFAGVDTGDRVFDLGCGTGSLAFALAGQPEPSAVIGIAAAGPYIVYARSRCADPRVSFRTSDALALDWPSANSCGRAISVRSVSGHSGQTGVPTTMPGLQTRRRTTVRQTNRCWSAPC
jgi:ubiquinone/menaquinone biosynthesis C-methylase UbiE